MGIESTVPAFMDRRGPSGNDIGGGEELPGGSRRGRGGGGSMGGRGGMGGMGPMIPEPIEVWLKVRLAAKE